jgi:Ig-like domain CHU_C associated
MKVLANVKNIPPKMFFIMKLKSHYLKSFFLLLLIFQYSYSYSFSKMKYSPNISNVVNSKTIRVFNSTHLVDNNLKASFVSIPYLLKNENHNFVNQLIINTTLNTSYCTGESSLIACQANGVYNSNNVFSVVLSDSSGSFSTPTIIGTLTGFASGANTLNFKIPTNIPVSSKYRIRLMASSPLTTSTDNGFNISITTIPAPTFPTQLICKGQSVVLAATCNQGTAQWYDAENGGNLISNLTVTPVATTDYFASCVQGTTCVSARKVHTVNVSNFDNVAVPLSASSCLNSDLELAVITDDNSLRYAWSGPNGFTSTSQTPIITNLTSAKVGVYTVLITNSNNCTANGTTSVSIGQTLQSLNVTGDVSVCFNGTISLTAVTSVASGMTYSWSGPNSFTSTGQSISRIAFTLNGDGTTTYHAGEYTVVASNSTTGCSGTNSVSIAVGNRPNVFAMPTTGSACDGTTYTINWNLGGANFKNYSWSGPNGFTSSSEVVCDASFNCNHASVSIPNFTAINAGIYTITANFVDNLANTCAINASKNVSVKYGPELSISSNTAVCLGDALFFYSNANIGISSYAWTGPNNFTSSLQNPTIFTNSLAGSGVYKLTAVGINSCVGTATSFANILQSVPPIIQPTASVVLGNSITLTASGCDGTLLWFNATDNQSVTMPVSPTVPTAYYTKCNLEGCISGKSYDISVSIKPPIAISVKTGDWEDATTWDIDRVPLPIDSVIIRPNHIITINTLCYAKWLAWTGFGNLIFKSSQSKLNLFGNPIIPPPTISANPSNVIEGISVTFTATGNGTITWYKNGISLNINGSTYTVNQPVGGDVYTAKASVNGVFSVVSNIITVSAALPTNIAPPVLSSNPSTVIEGISVTFTATGSGINWYKNGVNLNISGTTYTVSQPVTGDIYTAKASANGLFSVVSNAITVEATPPPLTVSAPVLDSSPVNVIEGIPVTFTATGSGVISWFKNGVDLNISGTNYSVNQPVRNDIYTAKRTVNTVLSGASNAITVQVPVNTGVTIIEPNKPAYYFSDGHPASYYNGNVNSPVIFTNQPRYDAANDFVWLKNDKIKIGINLKRGGQLAWASLIDATSNLVYNGYDGGFQVTIDAYQRKDGYTQDGEVAGSGLQGHPTFSYNVTQGGDYLNHAVSLIDYHTVPNGYYVKMRPIHYPLTAKLSETYIEATYTIIGRSVKIEYRYTSFRTDGQWDGGGFDGAGAPACFIVNTLNKYKTYTGSSPWSFLPTQGGTLPITNMGQGPIGAHTTEYWGMVYDPQNPNSGIGVYNQTNGGNSTYFVFKQQEVFPGNGPGTEFTSGYTFFQPFTDFTIPNRGNYVKDITAYLMIGSETEIRKEVYKFSGHEANIPVE